MAAKPSSSNSLWPDKKINQWMKRYYTSSSTGTITFDPATGAVTGTSTQNTVFKPMSKKLKEVNWDKIEVEDNDLFYIEERKFSDWQFSRGCGFGKKGLEKAKRSIARLGSPAFGSKTYRICMVNAKFKKPLCHVKR